MNLVTYCLGTICRATEKISAQKALGKKVYMYIYFFLKNRLKLLVKNSIKSHLLFCIVTSQRRI